jgi:hypothetical protein
MPFRGIQVSGILSNGRKLTLPADQGSGPSGFGSSDVLDLTHRIRGVCAVISTAPLHYGHGSAGARRDQSRWNREPSGQSRAGRFDRLALLYRRRPDESGGNRRPHHGLFAGIAAIAGVGLHRLADTRGDLCGRCAGVRLGSATGECAVAGRSIDRLLLPGIASGERDLGHGHFVHAGEVRDGRESKSHRGPWARFSAGATVTSGNSKTEAGTGHASDLPFRQSHPRCTANKRSARGETTVWNRAANYRLPRTVSYNWYNDAI